MKLSIRAKALVGSIATASLTALGAVPAFASEEATTTAAASPVDTGAILITGAVILAVVLLTATAVSGMLGKRG